LLNDNNTSVVLGISLYDDYFIAAFFEQNMNEAQIITNPNTNSYIWKFDTADTSMGWADLLTSNIQHHLNTIFQILGKAVEHITFTVDELTESDVCELLPVLEKLELGDTSYSLQEDNESFYDFVTFQNSELWTNEVVLFEARDNKLVARSLVLAAFPHEKALTVKKTVFEDFDFSNEDEETDERFFELVELFFDKTVISCVFLQGETFGKSWMKNTLKLLCKNRRVFGVSDIMVKGACYRGYRTNNDLKGKYYMGTHQLPFNLLMTVTNEGHEENCRLVRAATNWYDADFAWNFMINDVDSLHFITDPSINNIPKYIDLDISRMPRRPKYATKIQVTVHFAGKNRWYIKATDLGLGELYPSSNIEEISYQGEW